MYIHAHMEKSVCICLHRDVYVDADADVYIYHISLCPCCGSIIYLSIYAYVDVCIYELMFLCVCIYVGVEKCTILLTYKQVLRLHSSKCETKQAKWTHLHRTHHNPMTCQKH